MSSAGDRPPSLEAAYALETPDDNRRLYAEWADTYDESFAAATRYVYHQRVAELFLVAQRPAGPVLDVGCGTGLVGVELAREVPTIDGVDISPQMLDQAAATNVYRNLIEADLTVAMQVGDNTYAGVVSAGTFTHGHLTPAPLFELVRVAISGAVAVIGINSAHWADHGFERWFADAADSGLVTGVKVHRVPVYAESDPDDADQNSNVVVFVVG